MSTEAQVQANRANAQLSTGPRTDEGKENSSQNAFKHGLRSANPVAPGEDPSAWQAFALEVIQELDPAGIAQRLLAERIAFLQWKLLRIPAIEATAMSSTRQYLRDTATRRREQIPLYPSSAMLVAANLDTMAKLQSYEMRLQRALAQARREYQQLKQQAEAARDKQLKEQAASAKKLPDLPTPAQYSGFPDLRPGIPPAPSPWADPDKPNPDRQLQENRVRSSGSSPPPEPANPPAGEQRTS
jgi:hypothetical protein